MSFRISHPLHPIQQPIGSMDCVFACIAMARGRASNAGVQHVRSHALSHGVTLAANGGVDLALANIRRLADLFGFATHNVGHGGLFLPLPFAAGGRPNPRGLDLLRSGLARGVTILIGTMDNLTSSDNHALAVFRLEGDLSRDGTRVCYVDPATGRTGCESYARMFFGAASHVQDVFYVLATR